MDVSTSYCREIFTIENLPYGVVSSNRNNSPQCAVAYLEHAVILYWLQQTGIFSSIPGIDDEIFAQPNWNTFAALSVDTRRQVRDVLKHYLRENYDTAKRNHAMFVPLAEVNYHFPMETKNFSDFYCSYEHSRNCSAVFSGSVAPNWFVQPSVYNGRTSSLVVSGTPVTRPCGVLHSSMTADPSDRSSSPAFQPETQFDFELEMGVFLSKPVPRGQRLKIESAKDHIFGFVLLNDWSARMIQFFEMTPLGPFHGKGSGTSISPWIVPSEALEEVAACSRHQTQEPGPLPHLDWKDHEKGTYNVEVSCKILREGKIYQITESNLNESHFTPLQMITHLGSAGEGLSTGDIFGTGTLSSARTNSTGEKTGLACLWERKLSHQASLSTAPEDISKTLLKDGDEVIFEAWCKDAETGKVKLGFGECRGKVLPAVLP